MNMFRFGQEELEQLLKNNLEVKELAVIDLKGGDHWQVDIVASDFNGLSKIKQHKLVYQVLAEPLANESIHALVINSQGTE